MTERHFRPDRHSKAAYQAKQPEGKIRKLSDAPVNGSTGPKPQLTERQALAIHHAEAEDMWPFDGPDHEPTADPRRSFGQVDSTLGSLVSAAVPDPDIEWRPGPGRMISLDQAAEVASKRKTRNS